MNESNQNIFRIKRCTSELSFLRCKVKWKHHTIFWSSFKVRVAIIKFKQTDSKSWKIKPRCLLENLQAFTSINKNQVNSISIFTFTWSECVKPRFSLAPVHFVKTKIKKTLQKNTKKLMVFPYLLNSPV